MPEKNVTATATFLLTQCNRYGYVPPSSKSPDGTAAMTNSPNSRQPHTESAAEMADLWTRWLKGGEANRWVVAMRALSSIGIQFLDWGTGLPERKLRILPFCLEAISPDGKPLGQISKLADLRALALLATPARSAMERAAA